jgi:HlyD family secretion protein
VLEQARRDHQRATALQTSSVNTPVDVEKAAEKMAIAEADAARATAAIAEALSQVATAEESLRYHETRLADTSILAPFDALVIKRSREAGDVAVPGAEILQIVSADVLWISAWVDESAMSLLKTGQPAHIAFRSEPEKSYAGEVARLGRRVDRETREFVADVQVRDLPAAWAIGQRAEVYIETARRDSALSISLACIQRRDGKTGVFVARDGRAVWQSIQCGLFGRKEAEVLGGLKAGDKVILPLGTGKVLADGQRIAPR